MCGIFGIRAPERDNARLTYFGLHALQHRGQESAGIAVCDEGRLYGLRDMGLVTQVFNEQSLRGLHGQLAIGHCRYSTTGGSHWENSQPLVLRGRERTVALAHNGNLTNVEELREELARQHVRLSTSSDSEIVAAMIANDERPLEEAVAATMSRLVGAYSIVALAESKLLAFRDPHGIRPLCFGRLDDDWVEHPALCIFELFYLARPDSRLLDVEVHGARVRMGEILAAESPVEADLVMPIPDSGTPAAIGFSRGSGIPFSEGLIKNRYVGRTFIEPDQKLREQGVRLKFNPLDEVAGKRVVVVDDSIVRGSTTRKIVVMLFDAGATEVHVRISSPPVVFPCFYGIDFGDADQLIAGKKSVEEVRRHIGATSLAHLSLEGLQKASQRPATSFCRACLDGEYPTPIPAGGKLIKLRLEKTAESRPAARA
jgi:amidophosphoribosyltransferase